MALASAQFIMVLDSTVMNVSIQKVIDDLDSTVTRMQLAIAAYTLTMAALMMVGGKVGDIVGRRRAFRAGLVLYGLGAAITAAAPSMGVLILGWSIVEAIGAALMIPAVAALIAANYEGADRALCYGVIGGMAGAAAAAGPIIGGWVSTQWSWRDVFAAEAVIVVGLLAASRVIRDLPRPERPPRLDVPGALLSAAGLALVVLGVVQSTDWGWIHPKAALTIAGTETTPFGFSAVPLVILAGLVLLYGFAAWERHTAGAGRDPLVRLEMLRVPRLRAGLASMVVMTLALGGTFFVLPLYLQIVLGKDPLDTGVAILPLSVAVFAVSLGASRLSSRVAPRRIIRAGVLAILLGAVLLMATVDPELRSFAFGTSIAVLGAGLGLMASQIGNVNLSAVGPAETSEVGGLQGTAQNLGTAVGTALIGSILLGSLTGAFDRHVESNPSLPAHVRSQVTAETKEGIQFVPAATAETVLRRAGLPSAQVDDIDSDYRDAQISALKVALGAVATVALLGLAATRRLPAEPLSPNDAPASGAT